MKPYKYFPEVDTISNGEYTLHVLDDMPEWEGQDLIEDVHFSVDLHPDDHNMGVALPIKNKHWETVPYNNGMQEDFKVGDIVYFTTGIKGNNLFPEKLHTNNELGYEIKKIGTENTSIEAVGEPTKPPRKYKIENFRLIKPANYRS